ERMLPSQARRHVRNLGHFVVPMPTENAEPVPIVDPTLLTLLAGICESNELLRFEYLLDDPHAEQRADRRPAEQRAGAGPPPSAAVSSDAGAPSAARPATTAPATTAPSTAASATAGPATAGPATARPGRPSLRRATPLPAPSRFEVEPYLLINRSHRWYLLAYDPDRSE